MESYVTENVLKTPSWFDFPFPPYTIQEKFMSELYAALETRKLGIFESPTGTGKSLSIICGALRWLQDHETRIERQLTEAIECISTECRMLECSSSDDWLASQAKQVQLQDVKRKLESQLEFIKTKTNEIKLLREKLNSLKNENRENKFELSRNFSAISSAPNDDFLLEEISLDEDDTDLCDEEDLGQQEEYKMTKIYFCSRTHSQLSQFINEVRRSPFAMNTCLVPLASRQNYCINPEVKKLKNLSLVNERCLELQKKKYEKSTKQSSKNETLKKLKCSSGGCQFYNKQALNRLSDELIVNISDIEDLVKKGQEYGGCPYYTTRSAITRAQLVVVPYNTLLHKSTREASKIHLEGNVVIIDEAHNLLDAVGNMYSSTVTGNQLCQCYCLLTQYKNKYETRFSAVNLLHLNQLIYVIGQLTSSIGGKPGINPAENSRGGIGTKIYTLPEFVHAADIDNFNLYKLLSFCEKSKISHKLQGFSECTQPLSVANNAKKSGLQEFLKQISSKNMKQGKQCEGTDNTANSHTIILEDTSNPVLPVINFLSSLTNHCEDGRVVCSQQVTVGRGSLKFLLLNPAAHFKDIVEEARAVIVAGGTMQPISEFQDQLFKNAGADSSRICSFSCGHIIPPENILPIVLTSGPSGKQLDFSFQSRTSVAMLNELGRILTNICNIIPAGIVCFMPSYEYEDAVFKHLEKTGVTEKISKKKMIFREPKKSNETETVLTEYAAVIQKRKNSLPGQANGALMFSVIGGKLSEGLNFSDDLGRCVVVVGLPYPNITSPELQEKMKYLDQTMGPGTGKKHYENLCMKAVNQSIGRAIRHKDDYATVLLLDHRYLKDNVLKALPNWMSVSLKMMEKFGAAFSEITKFFASKKKVDCAKCKTAEENILHVL